MKDFNNKKQYEASTYPPKLQVAPTWRIIPVSDWLVNPIYKPANVLSTFNPESKEMPNVPGVWQSKFQLPFETLKFALGSFNCSCLELMNHGGHEKPAFFHGLLGDPKAPGDSTRDLIKEGLFTIMKPLDPRS